jgi:hypothetical protein
MAYTSPMYIAPTKSFSVEASAPEATVDATSSTRFSRGTPRREETGCDRPGRRAHARDSELRSPLGCESGNARGVPGRCERHPSLEEIRGNALEQPGGCARGTRRDGLPLTAGYIRATTSGFSSPAGPALRTVHSLAALQGRAPYESWCAIRNRRARHHGSGTPRFRDRREQLRSWPD